MGRASGRPPRLVPRLAALQLEFRRRLNRYLDCPSSLRPDRSLGAVSRSACTRLVISMLGVVLLVAAGIAVGTIGAASSSPRTRISARLTGAQLSSATWYAPYVDATLPPEYLSADRSVNPADQTVFGFIVSTRSAGCTPSWGDYFSLSSINSSTLHLGSVISAMQAEGEQPIVSFGGEDNQPLADACTTANALASAYEQVIGAYHLKIMDFDIEGAAQGDTAALLRQAHAIKEVQAQAAAQGSSIGIWLTVPVGVTGMQPVAENVVNTMLNGGVELSGVNLMTMYFSPSPGDGAPMLSAVEGALDASHGQLDSLFASHGIDLSAAQVWRHMGATVQIGQAGIADQAFTVTDAQGLVSFAEAHAIGRISDWSANQDAPCGSASDPTVGGYSTYCSGVVQTPGQFGQIFGQLTGLATTTPLLGVGGTATSDPSGSSGGSKTSAPTTTSTAVHVATHGYWMVAGDGGVFDFGTAQFHGSMGGKPLNKPVVASAATPTGSGYWEVAGDGGLFSFGTAQFHGSMGGKPLNKPVVAMAADPATGGYWEVASDGGIFSFDAPFYGSMGGKPLNKPIVGMAATPTGRGYWLVASDGGIFSFGNAEFHGSMGGKPLNQPIVGMTTDTTTGGYWLTSSTGGVFSFGAPFHGSATGSAGSPVVGMGASATGNGYWIGDATGQVFGEGVASDGTMTGKPLNQPMVGFAVS